MSSTTVVNLAARLRQAAQARQEARKGVVSLMKALVLRLVRDDEGQDLIEYVLIGALISTAIVAGASTLGTNLNTWYQGMADWISLRTASI